VLHRVRDIRGVAIDAYLRKGAVENLSDRAHERLTCQVFGISPLFPHSHEFGRLGPGAEHCLGPVGVEAATSTTRTASRSEANERARGTNGSADKGGRLAAIGLPIPDVSAGRTSATDVR
jgi:hypothetical protein